MKKIFQVIVPVIVLLSSFNAPAADDKTAGHDKIILKYGLDMNGSQDYPVSSAAFPSIQTVSYDIDMGSSILLELQHPVSDLLSIGLGATFNFNRPIHDTNSEFSFIPIYATASFFPVGNANGIAPYVKADIGYNISYAGNDAYKFPAPFETTLAGGLYWGVGAGVEFVSKVFIDVMYTSYSGNYKVGVGPLSASFDSIYTKISLNAGIGLDI